jgi:hypothetical protein
VSANVEIEEIQTTKSEKLLAFVLAVFLLIGGIWFYTKLDRFERTSYQPLERVATPAERTAIDRYEAAQQQLATATERVRRARQELVFRREAYRTALDANEPARQLRAGYENAQASLTQAQDERAAASAAVRAARPAADAAFQRVSREQRESAHHGELTTFALRLGYVLAVMGLAYWLLGWLRRRRSRYLPLGMAAVGFAAILALFMAGDYLTDYIDVRSLGPFVLSFAGIALTVGAFVGLQRYLARRIPYRRVRKGECPFCGYPVHGNDHCEGCGRTVVGECTTCARPRRVGTLHCGACGQA